jgi:hypothetical protein
MVFKGKITKMIGRKNGFIKILDSEESVYFNSIGLLNKKYICRLFDNVSFEIENNEGIQIAKKIEFINNYDILELNYKFLKNEILIGTIKNSGFKTTIIEKFTKIEIDLLNATFENRIFTDNEVSQFKISNINLKNNKISAFLFPRQFQNGYYKLYEGDIYKAKIVSIKGFNVFAELEIGLITRINGYRKNRNLNLEKDDIIFCKFTGFTDDNTELMSKIIT